MQVIADMTTAYFRKDFDAWARCWAQDTYVRRWMWFRNGGVTVREGWDQQAARMRRSMAANPVPAATVEKIRRENINIRFGGDMAWVTFDQYGTSAGDSFDLPGLQKEMRVLERHGGHWKVVFFCALQRSLEGVTSPLLRVDDQAKVLWMSDRAKDYINGSIDLLVRAGRIRARDRLADQRLQAAVRWAASLDDGFAERNAPLPFAAQRGVLPVVLDGGRGEPASVCWVMAESGYVLISLSDRGMTEERLSAGALVYGLTPAQVRVAKLIINGNDIVSASKLLGVSVNTARTHLQRMYDRTGVRTQPALVRALLSVSPPLG